MDVRLTDDEVACVKKLAERFEKSDNWVMVGTVATKEKGSVVDALDLPPEKREAILGVMGHMGLLANVTHAVGLRFARFQITPKSVQVARAIRDQEAKKEEPTDMVEQLKNKAKSNPFLAWAIVVFGVTVFILVGVDKALTLLDRFRIPAAQKAAPISSPAPLMPRTDDSPALPEK